MIHRVRIQNFKSLRDVTVELGPVTVFIGKSGTGKTNFAEAIRFLRDCLALDVAPAIQKSGPVKCATNPSGATEFEIEFDVPGAPDRFVYRLALAFVPGPAEPLCESLSLGGRTVFSQTGAKYIPPPMGVRTQPAWKDCPPLEMPPAPGPLAIRRLPGVTEAVTAYAALTAGIGVYTFPLGVLSPAGPQRPGGAAPGLADDASDYLAAIRDITTDLNKANVRGTIAATLRRINETVISVDLDSLQNPQTAIVAHQGPNDKRLTFELRQESEGFRRFYAHLLALYQTPPKQTLVFEEPENGIYPGALSLLADEFKAAPEADRGQVLLTTHSPALLDHFSDEQIRVVELADLETEIGPLAPEQRAALREKLLYAGELLTVDPARRAAP